MTLPPLTVKCVNVERGEIDLEIHAAFVEYLIAAGGRERLQNKLNEQLAVVKGIREALSMYKDKDARCIGALAPLTANLFALRHWVGLQKADAVRDMVLAELKKGNRYDKIVIFAMCRDVIVHIKETINRKRGKEDKIRALALFPGTDPEAVKRYMWRFNNVNKYRVMVCDVEAALPHIDLTRANEVMFAEHHWDPSVNAQAIMRVHNGNQKEPVRVRFARLEKGWDHAVTGAVKRTTHDILDPFRKKGVDIISTADKIDASQGENPT